MASGVDLKDSERAAAGLVMSFPTSDSTSPSKLPRRLRRRLLAESKTHSTAEEIEAKLKEAELRRQKFYDTLSSKARPKPRSPSWSSSYHNELNQRLEARLNAAEQKRLSIIAEARTRLSKLDELRQAAKVGVEMRFEKERDELGMKVESRIQQAQSKRMLILRTNRQLRAARRERIAQSLMRRMMQESKYRECVRAAIYQKRLAAERRRLRLLEAERSKAHDRLLRVRRAAKLVCTQNEVQRMKKKDELEERLQRARRLRAENLKQRLGLHCSPPANTRAMVDQAEPFVIKLARCWRQFVSLRGSTYSLAKKFVDLNINEESVKSMAFEKFALQIESYSTLQVVKSLLERLEIRLRAQLEAGNYSLNRLENIDHLLRRVIPPRRRVESIHEGMSRGIKRTDLGKEGTPNQHRMSRYEVRVFLCAYMILGHPDAVLSGNGNHENALADSAVKFVQGFEELLKIILRRCEVGLQSEESSSKKTFRSQLDAFDKAWCAYLYCFVVWKVNDAKSLEQDLVRASCQLELSMMQTCKMTPKSDEADFTHGMKAIQKQVIEDQRLLKEKVQNLSGSAGIDRMECAISDTRSKYFASREAGSSTASPITHITSLSTFSEDSSPVSSTSYPINLAGSEQSGGVARSLFKDVGPSSGNMVDATSFPNGGLDGELRIGDALITENELLVNEIVHGHHQGFAANLDHVGEGFSNIKEKVKETMEKAFWDGVLEAVKQEDPDYSWVLKLVTEVRDELCQMAPSSWKQEIIDSIDVDILSQVLAAGSLDMNYLGKILEYALATLRKLSAPSSDDEMMVAHQNLLKELAEVPESRDDFASAMIKGFKFVLHQIQVLKKEISKARITLIEPLIKGSAGVEYLQKAFSNRFGPPSKPSTSLPLTMRWLSSVKSDSQREWDEHLDSLSTVTTTTQERQFQGLPSNVLRTGGSVLSSLKTVSAVTSNTGSPGPVKEQPECTGERMDLLVRLGLLKLVSAVEGLTADTLAETLLLNIYRLRSVQNMLQKVIVISTSMLLLRQALLAENVVSSPSQMETIVSKSIKRLSELLDKPEDENISDIIQALFEVEECSTLFPSSAEKLSSVKEIVANMLVKSLQSGDPIFTRVSQVIYLAMRALVLGGTGSRGLGLADVALRRIGVGSLVEKLVEAAEILVIVAAVSESVHGAWYDQLLKEM